jgi:hypothetical protein
LVIEETLRRDQDIRRTQRHIPRRIFDELKAKHGYTGGYTVVKEVVGDWVRQHREVFVPLIHNSGEAQVDFGSAEIIRDEQPTKAALWIIA